MSENEKIIIHADPELAELIPGFLENRRRDIIDLKAALGGADYEKVRALSHAIKGAGGGYGFDGMTQFAGALEQAAKERNEAAMRQHLNELDDYIRRVEVSHE